MDTANLQLSPEEMALVLRSDWILTKNRVQQKAWHLLESLQSAQQKNMHRLPPEVSIINAKISKGENYLGLPYLILDQPRYFNKTDVFAIRTMFWWGHSFSCTLHLAGNYKENYKQKIQSYILSGKDGIFVCVNQDPWHHHFGPDNYLPAKEMTKSQLEIILQRNPFVKISSTISLEQWENAVELLKGKFEDYLQSLGL